VTPGRRAGQLDPRSAGVSWLRSSTERSNIVAGCKDWTGLPLTVSKGGVPRLVTTATIIESPAEALDVEGAVLADGDRLVVTDLVGKSMLRYHRVPVPPTKALPPDHPRLSLSPGGLLSHEAWMCSSVTPRKPRFGRHRMASSARVSRGNRPSRVSKGDLPFHAGERGAEAEVGRPAEGQVPVVLACQVDPVGIAEALGIPVGGAHHGDHRRALGDVFPPRTAPAGARRAVCWLGLS